MSGLVKDSLAALAMFAFVAGTWLWLVGLVP